MQSYVIWITGLAGAGKTTLAERLVQVLRQSLSNVVHIDGDIVREIFGNDLGYDEGDRLANAFRISRMCKMLYDQGVIVVCSTISLFPEIWKFNRENIGRYCEVFVDVNHDTLKQRNKKSLYSGVSQGSTSNVVGLDQKFTQPAAHLVLSNNQSQEIESNVARIMTYIQGQFATTTAMGRC